MKEKVSSTFDFDGFENQMEGNSDLGILTV
jgi:hypothetical protein